ncbi:hypothetical protein [Parasedimentitalea psychrophila]|uniref:Tc1-like transposase DDE domain-containing protein n=1 Tax=Parasedimentitalea psychrophila TaxID=2997337 RepID=A0A9Y2KZC6_9RHOB|nr:hypothetical protein [Parasedimentitalea psychrophila]WIY24532.1 hypothetical protein QPJ95_18615 [Parasedimentitalea psychrophila]
MDPQIGLTINTDASPLLTLVDRKDFCGAARHTGHSSAKEHIAEMQGMWHVLHSINGYPPAHSPDLNHIEHKWAEAKSYRRNPENPSTKTSLTKTGIKIESSGYMSDSDQHEMLTSRHNKPCSSSIQRFTLLRQTCRKN